jgi:hypothetical protein
MSKAAFSKGGIRGFASSHIRFCRKPLLMWMPAIRHELSREALYDLIWDEPVYKLAVRYKINGVALAKISRKAKIPLPPRGYWAKRAHGKKPRKTLLKAISGVSETITIREGEGPRGQRPPKPELDERIARAIERERLPENKIVVTNQVSRLHPKAKRWRTGLSRLRRETNETSMPTKIRNVYSNDLPRGR